METTTPETLALRVVQRDLVETARSEAAALKREGAEAIVALTQAPASVNERLLREVPLIDAILTEEEAEERSVVHFVGARPIAAPCGNLGSVVELRLRWDSGRITAAVLAHPVDGSVRPDAALAARERIYMDLLAERLAAPVATLTEGMPADGSRVRETALGSLVADALREAVGAQVALIPGSSLRADLPAGALTRREILGVLPFGNTVVLLELQGSVLRAALEKGLSGSLLQVSGLSYSADPAAPASRRLREVAVGSEPLRDDGLYRVAVTSYLASGGEGFTQLATAHRIERPGGEPVDADALATHLSSRRGEPPAKAARITLRSDSDRR
ncbi:MAG: bifunctional metallophosphatase/5'-nucleotidase [Acidobacteria bacterium]|nr:bifunctional metallophosphatase/5'-nucleotidase [Acidobacteriota bacterium]